MHSVCLGFLASSLEGCVHLVDQLLVLSAGTTAYVARKHLAGTDKNQT